MRSCIMTGAGGRMPRVAELERELERLSPAARSPAASPPSLALRRRGGGLSRRRSLALSALSCSCCCFFLASSSSGSPVVFHSNSTNPATQPPIMKPHCTHRPKLTRCVAGSYALTVKSPSSAASSSESRRRRRRRQPELPLLPLPASPSVRSSLAFTSPLPGSVAAAASSHRTHSPLARYHSDSHRPHSGPPVPSRQPESIPPRQRELGRPLSGLHS